MYELKFKSNKEDRMGSWVLSLEGLFENFTKVFSTIAQTYTSIKNKAKERARARERAAAEKEKRDKELLEGTGTRQPGEDLEGEREAGNEEDDNASEEY
jgi:hypothetical protein